MSLSFQKHISKNSQAIKKRIQSNTNGHNFTFSDKKVFEVSDEERERIFEDAWAAGGLGFRACFQDIAFDKDANDLASEFIKRKIRSIVNDDELAEKLTNINHAFASKRPAFDSNYFILIKK